jgi:hypothetical protein
MENGNPFDVFRRRNLKLQCLLHLYLIPVHQQSHDDAKKSAYEIFDLHNQQFFLSITLRIRNLLRLLLKHQEMDTQQLTRMGQRKRLSERGREERERRREKYNGIIVMIIH